MNRRVNASMVRILAAAMLVTAFAGTSVADAPDAGWCPYMATAAPARSAAPSAAALADAPAAVLLPRQARYDVDVMGNFAYVTLSLEFVNSGDDEAEFRFHSRRPEALLPDSLTARADEMDEPRVLEYELPKVEKPAAGRSARTQNAGSAASFASEAMPLAAEEAQWVRVGFSRALTFEQGRFTLSLPAVGGACPTTPGGQRQVANLATPLNVELRVHHGEPLEEAASPSHEVLVEFEGDHTIVELVAPDPLGQNSFRFDYALGLSDEPVLTSFVTPVRDNGEREMLMVLAPAITPDDEQVRPKEVLFVLDTSGSMRGAKIEKVREALGACLAKLGEADRFNVVEFDGAFSVLFEEPQTATPTALTESAAWLAKQQAGGSTTLLPALAAAFEQDRDPEHHRVVVVLTDGALGDQKDVLSFLREHLDEARLFFVGVGTEPNREKVMRLAQYGRGTAVFADDAAGFALAVQDLFDGISSPLAWDLELDWAGTNVVAMEPRRLPDLYKGRPVTVKAVVRGDLPATLVLEATTADGVRAFEAVLPSGGALEYPQLRGVAGRSAADSKRKPAR